MKAKPIISYAAALAIVAAFSYPTQAADDPASRAPSKESLMPTAAEREARIGWWREARFGMFVHWGVYSSLSGTWNGKKYKGYGEHIQRMAKIPISVYHKEVAGNFNPKEFVAEEWVKLAKDAGMGYLVITAKHHDGFAMYDSKVSDATIVKATPFARDPMKELKAACTKHGMKFGFYYSHAFDWGEENGPGNDWDFDNPGGDKLLHGANWWEKFPEFLPKVRKYVDEKAIPQLKELIANYDPDIIWFDTPHKLPPEENQRILAAVRKAKPSLVINSRLISGLGDYQSTCDRPAEFPPQNGDWEGVPTTNESYGYNANDRSHKPVSHFIQLLAKSAARGGNELMNIGPMGNGKIDQADLDILKGIGKWWAVNGESIRGTARTPLAVQAWGESTRKGNSLYLHVFQWPNDGKLVVGGLKTDVANAYLLSDKKQMLQTRRSGMDLVITIPKDAPDTADSVVVVECAGQPAADSVRLLSNNVPIDTLRVFDGVLKGKLRFGQGKKVDDVVTDWTQTDCSVSWPVRLNEKGMFDVIVNYDAPAGNKAQVTEGDAGKELRRAQKGAAGTYIVSVGGIEFAKPVRQGSAVKEKLGSVTLAQGNHEISVSTKEITGNELFRLRNITLSSKDDSVIPQQLDPTKTGSQTDVANPAEKSVKKMQDEFLKLKFGMFIHYNMETYKGVQWVSNYQNPADFNPGGRIDTDAWADAAKSAGMKYAILTAKHVSGFCLWDSKYTTYDVMNPACAYQQDLVAQFIKSFTSRGLKVGLYYCWRNKEYKSEYKVLPPECDPETHSFAEQVEFQKKQITELVEKYPEAFCIWNDGLEEGIMPASEANAFYRSLGRNVLGIANWWDWNKKGTPFLDVAVKEMKELPEDNQYPGETCWTLEKSWFWSEGTRPKPAKEVVDLLQRANGRHSNFLLNVGPNKQGRFEPASIEVLAEIGKLLNAPTTEK